VLTISPVWIATLGHEGVEEVVTPAALGLVPPVGSAIDHLFHGLWTGWAKRLSRGSYSFRMGRTSASMSRIWMSSSRSASSTPSTLVPSMIMAVDAEPERVVPDSADQPPDDKLARRLDYALTALNIAGAILVLVYMVQVLDETSGGALKRRWDAWREAQRHKAKAQREYDQNVKRLQFEAWSALRDASIAEDTDE